MGEGLRESRVEVHSSLGWVAVAQTGQDVVGLWAAEASSPVAHGEGRW